MLVGGGSTVGGSFYLLLLSVNCTRALLLFDDGKLNGL